MGVTRLVCKGRIERSRDFLFLHLVTLNFFGCLALSSEVWRFVNGLPYLQSVKDFTTGKGGPR